MPVLEPCGCQLVRGTNEFRRRCDLHSADKAEVERLRALLREWYAPYADHWCQPDDLYGRTRAALAGTGDQPSAAPYVNPECLNDGIPCASDGAGGCCACDKRFDGTADNGTEGHMEKRNAD